MPWEIIKRKSQFCVVKKDTGEIVPGGCYRDRQSAVQHLRALYANLPEEEKRQSLPKTNATKL